MGVYNVWDYEMNLEIKTVSNWHDGSFCLHKDGKVKKHIIGERVVHDKHLNNNNMRGRCVYNSKKIINYFDENIEDVICSCDDMDLKIESVERLEIIYNKLKDNNNE